MGKHKQFWVNDDTDELLMALLHLGNLVEARAFLRDLLTEKEIAEFANRWKAARMLEAGIEYKKIERATGMSSATVARVHKWLTSGEGGYRMMLRKLK